MRGSAPVTRDAEFCSQVHHRGNACREFIIEVKEKGVPFSEYLRDAVPVVFIEWGWAICGGYGMAMGVQPVFAVINPDIPYQPASGMKDGELQRLRPAGGAYYATVAV